MEILLVGHISSDLRNGKTILGGPISYQYPIMKLFTKEITIITSFNPDSFDFDSIFEGVSLNYIKSDENTTYEFEMQQNDEDDRILYLKSKAEDLDINYLKKICKPRYDLLILSPIANEIGVEEIEFLNSISTNSVIDMQGFVRHITVGGKVVHDLDINLFDRMLSRFDIIKISKSELGNHYPPINKYNSLLLVTDGGNSVEIYQNNVVRHYPLDKQEIVKDSTGSGDIFLAVFSSLIKGEGEKKAIKVSHEVAKLNLNNIGVPIYQDIKETYENLTST